MTYYVEPVRSDFWQLYKQPGESGYDDPLGPKNCQTHSAARSIMRANEGLKPAGITGIWPPTGEFIRRYTGESVGGTNHSQMVAVARDRYKTVLTALYAEPFDDVVDMIASGRGAQLSVWYRRFRDSKYRGSLTFYENHEFYVGGVDKKRGVFTNVVDPLANGDDPNRPNGLYQGPGEYPISLFKTACGELNVSSAGYRALGYGRCYALLTKATGAPPVNPPQVVLDAPTPSERNVMISQGGLTVTTSHVMRLAKGQPIFRHPGGPRITAMSQNAAVAYFGTAGSGWRAIRVTTKGPYADGVARPTVAYVPANAGPVEAR